MAAFARCWPTIFPSVIWTALVKLSAYHSSVRQPHFSLRRFGVVLLSTHLRTVQWLTLVHWPAVVPDGLRVLASPTGIVLSACLIGCLILMLRRSQNQTQPAIQTIPLPEAFMLAWGFFLSSRLVFLLAGGMDISTRHNYGAAIAAAVAVAALLDWLCARWADRPRMRAWLIGAVSVFLFICCLACDGIGAHYVRTAQAEKQTYDQFAPLAPQFAPGQTLVIIGSPVKANGESAYYSQNNGAWLEWQLNKINPDMRAFVLPAATWDGSDLKFEAINHKTTLPESMRVPSQLVVLFVWHDGKLERVLPGQSIPIPDHV
jgi:hypothetical protein